MDAGPPHLVSSNRCQDQLGSRICALDGQTPTYIANTLFDEYDGRFSPDGRWLAYVSNDSGCAEVYVQPFPVTGRKWMVSSNGGAEPRWRAMAASCFTSLLMVE